MSTTRLHFAAGLALAGFASFAPAVSGAPSFRSDFDFPDRMTTCSQTPGDSSESLEQIGLLASSYFSAAAYTENKAKELAAAGEADAGNLYVQAANLYLLYIRKESELVSPNFEQLTQTGKLLPVLAKEAEKNGADSKALGKLFYDLGMIVLQTAYIVSEGGDKKNAETLASGGLIYMHKAANLGNEEAIEFLEDIKE